MGVHARGHFGMPACCAHNPIRVGREPAQMAVHPRMFRAAPAQRDETGRSRTAGRPPVAPGDAEASAPIGDAIGPRRLIRSFIL
jgi:hypothetical protein